IATTSRPHSSIRSDRAEGNIHEEIHTGLPFDAGGSDHRRAGDRGGLRRRSGEARQRTHAVGRGEGRQRGRLHTGMGWRPHLGRAGGLRQLPARPASPRPVCQRQAVIHGLRGQHEPVRQQTHGRPQEAAADLSQHVQDDRVSHASQWRRAATHLRRHQAHRDTAELAKGGNGVINAGEGIPFPVPKSGVEVFWNHVLRYRGDVIIRNIGQAPVTAGGDYTMVKFRDETMVAYSLAGAKSENLNNIIAYFFQETVAPARLAGEILLVHETLDQSVENRKAWVYNPGQRRVRRAPNFAFDNPGTNSDNLRTSDQFDMYNGSPE